LISGLFFVGATVPVDAAIPTTGLVANYEFTANAQDKGPHALHGQVSGATLTADRFGTANAAYRFDGVSSYIQIPDHDAFSVPTTGDFSASVWMRPDVLTFLHEEGTGYVHWMGKGVPGQHEWVWRMYGQDNTEERVNRTSSYIFNLAGGLGAGSYVQEPVTPGVWSHYVVTISTSLDREELYKNGVWKDGDPFQNSPYTVIPQNGTAPVRIGTRDFSSYFQGAIDDIRFYNRVLTVAEIQQLYADQPAPPTPTATATFTSTATSRPRPTNTATPRPTATITPRPTSTMTSTATSTPRPTNTFTPTSTSTARPTATNTPRPTVTHTPRPTSTSTPRPTVTHTPRPTSTSRPTATATVRPRPSATATISTTGWYRLVNKNSGKCVDARSSGTANGTVIQQYTCNTTNAQYFQFQSVGGGYYRLGNRNNSSQVVHVTNASTADGAGTILRASSSAWEQQWRPVAETGGSWHFVVRHSGKCLHVRASNTADSVPLEQWTCNGTRAESFTLQPR
jgi:hypothetical protein